MPDIRVLLYKEFSFYHRQYFTLGKFEYLGSLYEDNDGYYFITLECKISDFKRFLCDKYSVDILSKLEIKCINSDDRIKCFSYRLKN